MITAVGNSKVKYVVQLNQKAKVRKEEGKFAAEGLKMFMEAPIERIRDIFVTESFYVGAKEDCRHKLNNCSYELVSEEVFAKLSDTKTPQGILCVLEQFQYTLEEMTAKEAPFLLLLEDLQDPGNLGTIFRTGEGAGIDGILLSRNCVDIYNPKTVRATMGSLYRIPFLSVESLPEAIHFLQEKDIHVYAAHLKGKNYYDSYSFTSGTAFLIGNEGNGLRKETADLAETYIKIPMEGQVESLNAAIASALFMYEVRRQRNLSI